MQSATQIDSQRQQIYSTMVSATPWYRFATRRLGRRKTAHGFVQVSPGKSRDLGEKGVVKLATDAGGNLRYLLRGPQPVEPLHQRALKRRRNFAFGQPGPAMRVDDPAFEECLCQLLDKERDAIRPLQN